jgi:hypothetical protein
MKNIVPLRLQGLVFFFVIIVQNIATKKHQQQQGVCHTVALPFTFKKYLKTKEELWKLKYLTMQKYNLPKIVLKETKILQDIIITLYNN